MSAIYPLAKQAFLSGSINMTTDTIKVALANSTYTYSAADQYFSSATNAVVGTPVTLTGVSVTNGVFNAANATFTAVSGTAVSQLIIYKETGTNTANPLIAQVNTGTGFPVTPNGGNITIAWDTGASKIFAL